MMKSSGFYCAKMCTSSNNIKDHEVRNVVVLSLSFTVVFTAYLSLQNLQSSLNQKEGLGLVSLSCIYGCIIVSSVLAPTCVKIFGEKISIITPWIIHVLYTGANFYPSFATLIPVSVLLGLASGPLWVSQSLYITKNAQSLSMNDHVTLSKMNGIFFTMYETTQITGNVLSSLILNQGSTEKNATNVIGLCGSYDCPLSENATLISEPEDFVVNIMLVAFLVFDLFGLSLTIFFLQSPPKSLCSDQATLRSSMASCFMALRDWKLAFLVPLIVILAQEQAVLWTDFTKSFISCPYGVKMVGYVMATYGAVTTVSALLTSRLVAWTGRQILMILATLSTIAVFIALLFWQPQKDQMYIAFAIAAVWGVAEGIWQTQSNSLVAYLFPDKLEAAFANYHTWKAFGFTLYFVMSNFLCVYVKLYYIIALMVVAFICYISIELSIKYF